MIEQNTLFKHIRHIQMIARQNVEEYFSGAYRSIFKGKGLELEDIREYQPGDDIRFMNWNVTARSATPFIKIFREERELSVILMVDISTSSKFSHTDRLKSDLIAELAAILALSAIHNQDRVGLLLFSSEIELYLPPQKSVQHVLRMIRELIYFKPKHSGTNLKKALNFMGKLHKRRGICFLISDFLTDNPSEQIRLIAKKHELIACHVYDSYEKNFTPQGLVTLRDLETNQELIIDTNDPLFQKQFQTDSEAHFTNIKNTFQFAGADFISLNTSELPVRVLQKFFRSKSKKI